MVGKLIFEFLIPAFLLGSLAWWGIKTWYLKYYSSVVKTGVDINKASAKYDAMKKPQKKGKKK